MKRLAGGLLLWLVWSVPAVGQDRDRAVERLATALQKPHPSISGIDPLEATRPTTLGIVTLVRPELPGEIVRVSVPIGELLSRAVRGIAASKQRRQEEMARRRVTADVQWFAAQHPSSKP